MYSMEMEAERRREVLAPVARRERSQVAATEAAKHGARAGIETASSSLSARPCDEPVVVTSGLRG
jgi:hypothetical protein